MKDRNPELDSLLKQVAAQNPPPLPERFPQEVWRQIRRQGDRQATMETSFFSWWINLVGKPQTIAAALMLALLLGTWTGFALNRSSPTQSTQTVQLQAFSPEAPGMLVLSIY